MIAKILKARHDRDLRDFLGDILGAAALFLLLWAGLHLPLFA
jgi:hypothetical protein